MPMYTMRNRLLRLFGRWQGIDVDAASRRSTEVGISDPISGRQTPRRDIRRVIGLVLALAVEDEAVAVQFFHDIEDDCLRLVEYMRSETEEGSYESRELAPAPGYFAEPALQELGRLCGGRNPEGAVWLDLWSRGAVHTVELEWFREREVRVYFGHDRPPLRSKGAGSGS
jgi:hypothetical protein